MKIFRFLRQSLHDLIYGRTIELPQAQNETPQVITIKIEKIVKEKSLESVTSNDDIVVNSTINAYAGDKPVILPFENPRLLKQFSDKNRDVVFKYILKRLHTAVISNLPHVTLFQFGKSHSLAQINKRNYETQLIKMMNWFVETEDYESALSCRDLIRQIKTNDVVDQSN